MTQEETNHIAAYLEGLLSEEERIILEEKIASSPAFRKEVDDYRFIWEQSRLLKRQSEFHTYDNWNRLQRRLHRASFRTRAWNWTRTAAAIPLLPLVISLFYLFSSKHENVLASNEIIEVTSAPGLVSKITLSDSTQIWLNSGSSLTYPRQFTTDRREVQLTGEAYFKVKSDKEHRFDVKVPGSMTVSAYGTEFNVSAYKEDATVEAVLTKGHIEIKTENASSEHLTVSQQATYNKIDGRLQVLECNIMEKTAWKDGKLIFRKAGIMEIAKKLSRHFNADFTVKGRSLVNYEFSATFTDESLSDILSILKRPLPWNLR
ncbi:MAG: FecR domain-containing protein [Bacteroides sp.]|nr:FecR domain-containing protein [Bacteroides sp.]